MWRWQWQIQSTLKVPTELKQTLKSIYLLWCHQSVGTCILYLLSCRGVFGRYLFSLTNFNKWYRQWCINYFLLKIYLNDIYKFNDKRIFLIFIYIIPKFVIMSYTYSFSETFFLYHSREPLTKRIDPAVSWLIRLRNLLIILLAVLNTRSDGADVAGMQRYFIANMYNMGNWPFFWIQNFFSGQLIVFSLH